MKKKAKRTSGEAKSKTTKSIKRTKKPTKRKTKGFGSIERKIKSLGVHREKPKSHLIITLIIIILILISLGYYFYTSGRIGRAYVSQCNSPSCLIENANNCNPAIYTARIGTSIIEMEILPDCAIKKTVVKLDETEPEEIRNYFEGRSMVCTYEKNNFDDDFAYQISGPLENCEGSLVQSINEVI